MSDDYSSLSTKATFQDDEIKAALIATHGIVTRAAEQLGCAPGTIYTRIKKTPELKEVQQEARLIRDEIIGDLAEDGLIEALKSKEQWAIQTAIKYKLRERGYVPATQFTGPNGEAFEVSFKPIDYRENLKALKPPDSVDDDQNPND